MAVKQLERIFVYDKKELKDPNPSFSIDKVQEIYANQFPELLNCKFNGPEIKEGKAYYTFEKTAGTNG